MSPATGATPQTTAHPEVLVVVNRHSDVSLAIGAYYRARRGIPAANLLELDLPLFDPSLSERRHERISRPGFVEKIRDPIERHLLEHDLVDTIEIIVTTKGVPLQVTGPSPREKGEFLRDFALASVDAELALLFTRLDGSTGVENTVNPPSARMRGAVRLRFGKTAMVRVKAELETIGWRSWRASSWRKTTTLYGYFWPMRSGARAIS